MDMNKQGLIPTAALTFLAMASCGGLPPRNLALDQATGDFHTAQSDPKAGQLAPIELKQAEDALQQATDAWGHSESTTNVNHLAYLTKQRVAIAQETAQRREAEAQARSQLLEAQLQDLKAQKTARGLVITLEDVLFDTDQAGLKVGGMRQVGKLAALLQQNLQRTAVIESHTEGTGSDAHNQRLATLRADAVTSALVKMGVTPSRLQTKGLGDTSPISDNSPSAGHQLKRSVEILLSADGDPISKR
jgi:outer membrane protein OmpA-like peptidoglycan-associated protein